MLGTANAEVPIRATPKANIAPISVHVQGGFRQVTNLSFGMEMP